MLFRSKEDNYNFYKEKIRGIQGLSILDFNKNIRSNHWFYALYVGEDYPLNRDEIIEYLALKKVQVRPIWGLINEQKPYVKSQIYKIEKAKNYLEHVVNIPCSSNLSKEDVQYVVDCLKSPSRDY